MENTEVKQSSKSGRNSLWSSIRSSEAAQHWQGPRLSYREETQAPQEWIEEETVPRGARTNRNYFGSFAPRGFLRKRTKQASVLSSPQDSIDN